MDGGEGEEEEAREWAESWGMGKAERDDASNPFSSAKLSSVTPSKVFFEP